MERGPHRHHEEPRVSCWDQAIEAGPSRKLSGSAEVSTVVGMSERDILYLQIYPSERRPTQPACVKTVWAASIVSDAAVNPTKHYHNIKIREGLLLFNFLSLRFPCFL